MSVMIVRAHDVSGAQIGVLHVFADRPPRVVRDEYASTWVLRYDYFGQPYYERCSCGEASLRVTQ